MPSATIEDAAQQVFLIATSKLDRIECGKERAFLVGTAVRVASNHRRSAAVRHECHDEEVAARPDETPAADELLEQKHLRVLLDDVLDKLPHDLRTVLVLFELEELDVSAIAEVLGIPRGTAASRLRRAREAFERAAQRARAHYDYCSEET
jgi:RNA polymerase sigma-70 factor (ECF subfamily)